MKSGSFVRSLKKILSDGCIFYTVITLLLYTGGMFFSTVEREWIPTLSMMFTVLLFSVLFSAVNYVVMRTKLPAVLKLLLHFAVTTAIFYVLFILWGGFSSRGSAVLVILLAYTLVYTIAALIVFAAHRVRAVAKVADSKYEKQFSMKE